MNPLHKKYSPMKNGFPLSSNSFWSNAIKYTSKGRVTIRVDDKQVLSISDTGIGIAKEDLPRIFEKVIPGTTAAQTSIHRLGLYLCKKILNRLSHRFCYISGRQKAPSFPLIFPGSF